MNTCVSRRAFKTLSPLGSPHLLVSELLSGESIRNRPQAVDDGTVGAYEVTDPSILPVVGHWIPSGNCRFLRWIPA
jgi:hypothetical protein